MSEILKPLKIYVAGPYTPVTSDLQDASRIANLNTRAAIKAGIKIIERGHIPFIPHLTHFIHLETEAPLSKEFYYEYDMNWLKCCDALYYLGASKGADIELAWAKQNRMLIFYSIEEIPDLGRRPKS